MTEETITISQEEFDELKRSLEKLIEIDAELCPQRFTLVNKQEQLSSEAKRRIVKEMIRGHGKYVAGINNTLAIVAEKYGLKTDNITPKLSY